MIADRFENLIALNLLWWVPVLAVLAFFVTKRRMATLKNNLSAKLLPLLTASASPKRRRFKLILELAVLTLFVIALARPQSGESRQKVKAEGVEVMLLVDVSNSMLAEDVRPSRLGLAKAELNRFLDLSGGDKVGLVAFAGSAVTLSPLTNDKPALKMFIDSLSPIAVTSQGTDFKRALNEAKSAFERGGVDPGDEGTVSRLILIASDGEDNEAGAMDLAKDLAASGVRIFTLSFGSEQGGTIPVRDDRGNVVGNLRDKDGKEVVTKVRGDTLRELAEVGKGHYYPVTFGGETIKTMLADFSRLQKGQFDDAEVTSYNENYQFYLFLAILLALIELAFSERRPKGRLWQGRYEVAKS